MRWIVVLIFALLGACAKGAQAPVPEQLRGQTEWRLTAIDGQASVDQSVVTLSIDVDRNKIGGSGGCNRVFANFRVNEGQLRVGPLGLTKRFCGKPKGVMEQETRYVQVLQAVDRFQLEGEKLTANGTMGKLSFTRLQRDSK